MSIGCFKFRVDVGGIMSIGTFHFSLGVGEMSMCSRRKRSTTTSTKWLSRQHKILFHNNDVLLGAGVVNMAKNRLLGSRPTVPSCGLGDGTLGVCNDANPDENAKTLCCCRGTIVSCETGCTLHKLLPLMTNFVGPVVQKLKDTVVKAGAEFLIAMCGVFFKAILAVGSFIVEEGIQWLQVGFFRVFHTRIFFQNTSISLLVICCAMMQSLVWEDDLLEKLEHVLTHKFKA